MLKYANNRKKFGKYQTNGDVNLMAVLIKREISEKFGDFCQNGRVMFFTAPCGFGKTVVAGKLLSKKRVAEVCAEKDGFDKLGRKSWDFMLADELQNLSDSEKQQSLCALIRDNPDKRFVLLSRGNLPGFLMPFRLSGLLYTVDSQELMFDRNMTAQYFSQNGLELSDTVVDDIQNITFGYPLALSFMVQNMKSAQDYTSKFLEEIKHCIFVYFDEAVYKRFELTLRRFLLDLAPFEEFDTELAKMASGDVLAGERIANLRQTSNMLLFDSMDKMHFWPVFREFLLWEQKREYTDEQRRALYARAGLCFELRENYGKALECYSKSGESAKVSELLIRSMALHPGMGHYEELDKYFMSLSEERIKSSPALMQGMSMLCSLHTDYEQSERWYNELREFASVRTGTDAAAKEAKSRIAFLDISLPQRGTSGLVQTISNTFKLFTNKEIKLPTFSVTSTLPSIMNGGKDFSDWSKTDDILYATMRLPVEAVLGKDGVGLADCALAESKFEKGEDVSARMLALVSKISEVQSRGTPDIEFALVGLLARSQMDKGRSDDAKRTVMALKERFLDKKCERFMHNINALLCRIALRTGDDAYIESWYVNKAPRNCVTFYTLKRYQYITQAMTELYRGDNEAVLMTLAPLEPYCRACSRHIDMIHIKTISAVSKYRIGDVSWKEDMLCALESAKEYGFVRTVGGYGTAVLDMLCEISENDKKNKFLQNVIKCARLQAVYYPDFLVPKSAPCEKLTDAEMQVLRLLCADKSNAEIGEILDIKTVTVKSHVSHILQKLGVSRRSQAKTTAQKLHII